eukprot:jgi/Chlat1/7908/Chrsp68S07350
MEDVAKRDEAGSDVSAEVVGNGAGPQEEGKVGEEEEAAVKAEVEKESFVQHSPAVTLTQPEVSPPASAPPPHEQQQQRQRLVIREMVLENFKSYAGEQRIGPFHKCFSSVVGPNGSGKSNVIDALLFVFARRAKQMRLNKVSELIHNSTHHQNLDYASVSVYFQEIIDTDVDEGFEVVPNSELVVTRVAYRNNTSKYLINGRNSNAGEVTTVLKGKGVDLDNNRFLILQGEVEQIAMMKPKGQGPHDEGLLEYLEDIIGTNQYVQQIEETAVRLEEMNDQRQGMVQRVKIVEKDLAGLEGPKKEAEAYQQKENELLTCRSNLYQLYQWQCTVNAGDFEAQREKEEEKLQQERAKLEEHKKELDELQRSYENHRAEHTNRVTEVANQHHLLTQAIIKELAQCQEDFSSFERKDIQYRESLKHVKSKLKKLDDKITKDAAKQGKLQEESAAATEEIPKLEAKQEKLGVKLSVDEQVLQQMLDGIKDEVEGYRMQLDTVQEKLAPWERQLSELQSQSDVASSERDLLTSKQTAAQSQYDEALGNCEDIKEKIVSKEQDISRMLACLEEQQATAKAARKTEQETVKRAAALTDRLKTVRGRVAEKKSVQSQEKSRGAVLKALLEGKATGKLTGIYGRLGDLGAIDGIFMMYNVLATCHVVVCALLLYACRTSKYDVAISTACGALDYLLVESTADAQKCVEFLRTNSLGVATFLILEKQRNLEGVMREKHQPPENVPRLFDLIKVQDERLLPAFFFALRNTVVAEDLEQATRIAYGKDTRFRRVVTLEGQLIETSGTMSGGGGRPIAGKMGSKVVAADAAGESELAKLEHEMTSAATALETAQKEAAEHAAKAAEAEKTVAELELAIPKAKMEVTALREQLRNVEQRLKGLKAAIAMSAEDKARVAHLENVVSRATAEMEKVKKSSAKLHQQVSELQTQIEHAGGEALKKQKQTVADLQQIISDTSSAMSKAKVLITTNAKAVEKLAVVLSESEKEREQLHAQTEQLKSDFKQLESEAFDVMEAVKKTQQVAVAVVDEKASRLTLIQAEYHDRKKNVDTLRTAEVELANRIDDFRREIKENRARATQWAKKIEDTRQQHADSLAQSGSSPDTLPATLTKEELQGASQEEAEHAMASLDEQLAQMQPNMAAINEYRRKEQDYAERARDLEKATSERDGVRQTYDAVCKRRYALMGGLDEFMEGFNTISMKLKEMYQMITLGGDAELELVDSLDPFSEGIVFSVRPPKKSWKNICNLSGGEKTLSSLALVFALHHYKPTPLYVMDEIDAALDFKNVSIVAHYIKERTKDAQFVIISLRNNMFELADRLVGIYKTDNTTKSVTINPGSFVVAAA